MSNDNIYKARKQRRTAQHPIRGVDYQVNLWGDQGDPLFVFLHGWGDCGATFQFVIDELQKNWFVVAPDMRGFGGSKADADSFWFPDYLADLDRLLGIYSPDTPVRLVGHSMGANIAGLYAGSLPERVSAFANVEGFGLKDSNPADAPQNYRRWLEGVREPSAFSTYADFSGLAKRIQKNSPRMTALRAEFAARCWGYDAGGRVHLHANARHKLPNAVMYRRGESEACWRQITAKILLIGGGDSEFQRAVDARLDSGNLDLPFPNAGSVIIDDAGHMLHFEAPAALAEHLESFLAKTL
ncbi:MAG: alpha/beta hydrolase [Gammaproteobacteria bacterium]|nr:alpha/beta hydrolase [Gammaproteobacteria bacterium]